MKKLAIVICLGLLSFYAASQPRPFHHPERMSDEEIIQMQTRDLVILLDLDRNTEDRFIKEYTSFRKEIDNLARSAKPRMDFNSEEEIEKAIQQSFTVSEQILQIRKKYYQRFRAFLKPSQIQMIYRMENEAGRRMPPRHDDGERPEWGTMR